MGPHIVFGADLVGVGVRVASCLHSISWTNVWILTSQTHYWDGEKKWLDFGDLDLIFNVTLALWNFQILTKKLVCTLSLEPNDGFWPNFIYDNMGWFKDLIRFLWPWSNFQGHHTIITVKMSLVCTLSPEPIGGFWPNLHRNTFGTWEKNDRFWWPWLHVKGHTSTLNVKFWPKIFDIKACLHPMSWSKWWILAKLYVLYHWDN